MGKALALSAVALAVVAALLNGVAPQTTVASTTASAAVSTTTTKSVVDASPTPSPTTSPPPTTHPSTSTSPPSHSPSSTPLNVSSVPTLTPRRPPPSSTPYPSTLHPHNHHQHCPQRCICFKTTVRCMFLQLDYVPKVHPDTTVLDLRFNRIKDIPVNAFRDLKDLNTLLLNNNHITRLQNGVFTGLRELRYLYLYKNRIREIDSKVFHGLNKLEQLYLQNNDMESIPSQTFRYLPSLNRLYLHFNKIDKFSPGAFKALKRLERLFLQNNKLHTVPEDAFHNMRSLKRLRLDSNPLRCDCSSLWLARLLRTHRETASMQTAASCGLPPQLKGKAVADLREQDFHCSKPVITKEPDDVEVADAERPVYFSCKAEGDPEPSIVWLHEGHELSATDPHYSLMTDGTLMVEKPKEVAPAGSPAAFSCMAKNPLGEVKSRVARMVTLKNKEPPVIIRPPRDWAAGLGDTVTLDCRATGFPPPSIQWTLDGKPLSGSGRLLVANDGTLVIEDLQRSDAGQYRCKASNVVDSVTAAAYVSVNVAPQFTTRPDNLTIKVGAVAVLKCIAVGSPTPILTWFKDGRRLSTGGRINIMSAGSELHVEDSKESDSGKYVCHAENNGGLSETAAQLWVKERLMPATLEYRPFNTEAMVGSSIEMPCSASGDPKPTIRWLKDGHPIEGNARRRISNIGSLRLYNVSLEDAGLYKCVASNGISEVSGQGVLSVKAAPRLRGNPGDRFVQLALGEATQAVDRAVNATLTSLFAAQDSNSPSTQSYSDLYRLIRYPDASARHLARAADIYEKTLANIQKHVEAGMKLNVSKEFSYTELLSPTQLQLVANLSGCMAHRPVVNCSVTMCFHAKYRSIDGTCNNLNHPMWGASLTGFRRNLLAQYENGFSTPIGWNKNTKYFGFTKPSARLVSTSIISTDTITPDDFITHMVMQWGQFLDHDLDHAIPSETSTSWDGLDCKKSCEYAAPCYPIEIPPNDPRVRNRRCIDFIRSSAICGSGHTSVFFDTVQPREQINQLTSFIDASQVYGFTDEQAQKIRNLTNEFGRLREGPYYGVTRKPYLPFPNPGEAMDCRRDPEESEIRCYLAGDIRANEQVGLLAMHTVWFREHNRIAGTLRELNPHWDGDTLYHEARKIVGAEVQHITYKHWLPLVIGSRGMEMLGEYKGYDPNVNPSISNVFATAALRFGHTIINPILHRLNSSFLPIPQGHLSLGKAFFSPWRLTEEGGMDPLLRGLFQTPAKLKTPQENLNSELTEHLFSVAHAVALDLAAINIQRGRDHGIPAYNDWRVFCNLSRAESFDDLKDEISSQEIRDKLKDLYGHPGNLDVWVGGILEDQEPGAKVGPTFRCLLVEQFRRLRDGDRFWYESPSVFKAGQLTELRQASLARVLCDNSDDLQDISKNVFILQNRQTPSGFLKCNSDELPKVNLLPWTECCRDCSNAGQFNSISRIVPVHNRRFRRDTRGATPVKQQTTPLSKNTTKDDDFPTLNNLDYLDVDDSEEQRIEGLESVLESFQKTLKQLRRKLRRLEDHCQKRNGGGGGGGNGHCTDADGKRRKTDESWQKDSCTSCVCKSKNITCTTIKCATLTCANQETKKGDCCPTCK